MGTSSGDQTKLPRDRRAILRAPELVRQLYREGPVAGDDVAPDGQLLPGVVEAGELCGLPLTGGQKVLRAGLFQVSESSFGGAEAMNAGFAISPPLLAVVLERPQVAVEPLAGRALGAPARRNREPLRDKPGAPEGNKNAAKNNVDKEPNDKHCSRPTGTSSRRRVRKLRRDHPEAAQRLERGGLGTTLDRLRRVCAESTVLLDEFDRLVEKPPGGNNPTGWVASRARPKPTLMTVTM